MDEFGWSDVEWDGYQVGRVTGRRTNISDQERAQIVRECIETIEKRDSDWYVWRAIGMLSSMCVELTEVNDEPCSQSETDRTETGGQPAG